MKGETEFNDRVEQEAFEQSQSIYNPEPSEQTKQDIRKKQLLRELAVIETEEHKNDPEIEAQKMARLRAEVKKHMREQKLNNEVVNAHFSQMDLNWKPRGSAGV